jgi:hypothetical protein
MIFFISRILPLFLNSISSSGLSGWSFLARGQGNDCFFNHFSPRERPNCCLTLSARSKVTDQFKKDKNIQLIYPPLFSGESASVVDKSACAYPWFNFIISSNGDLRLCNIGVIGNLKQSSFSNIKASGFVQVIYRRLLKGDYEDLCKNCYTISDMENIRNKSTFIREDIMVDRAQTGELVSNEKQSAKCEEPRA